MRKWIVLTLCALALLVGGLFAAKHAAEAAVAEIAAERLAESTTVPTELPETVPETTLPPETEAPTVETTEETEPTTEETEAPTEPYVLFFTEEEEELLLKLGMAERGGSGCAECVALVMRTVLNRVEAPKFSSSIKGVIYAEGQFTPACDGTLETAEPNAICTEALDMIRRGWDESQGALYYEWSKGESWHSRNLNLLFQHCDMRLYN